MTSPGCDEWTMATCNQCRSCCADRPHPTHVGKPGELTSLAAFLAILVVMGILWSVLGRDFYRPGSNAREAEDMGLLAALGLSGASASSPMSWAPDAIARSRSASYADHIAAWDPFASVDRRTLDSYDDRSLLVARSPATADDEYTPPDLVADARNISSESRSSASWDGSEAPAAEQAAGVGS
ncbi:uncharacterized protein AMSG_05984 [Thecamonas trahens ATCC 50062]|uniref:Uncharacterized protein n=1 Tax=Thecamonas trahens ATCC 50062 TaxID=461836 RepID=A0A0L0DBK3_THETB|nr:hypothetical protein AMSG_05984 [Thecamonas trahens ATCC 50062]KNC49717.1 hypothetical protein AMSG_05984 [Thecamonas trahens ATCC 50062]|eukprot:XP_013757508.1 hypothetical protein AMSG_05984 [Thecamonas trahens ATCC 50062]